jgi:hypothetical protein
VPDQVAEVFAMRAPYRSRIVCLNEAFASESTRGRISLSSVARPTNVDSSAGRLFSSAGLPSGRSAGNSDRRPDAVSWKIRWAQS